MKLKVMYHSRGGSTQKVANAIAQAVGQTAEAVPPAYPLENVGLLFLGAAVYAGKVDKKMQDFIKTLNPGRVKNVALFSTSGGQDTAIQEMRTMLKAQGINVVDETYLCKGKFFVFFNRKNPTSEELTAAQNFAKGLVKKFEDKV